MGFRHFLGGLVNERGPCCDYFSEHLWLPYRFRTEKRLEWNLRKRGRGSHHGWFRRNATRRGNIEARQALVSYGAKVNGDGTREGGRERGRGIGKGWEELKVTEFHLTVTIRKNVKRNRSSPGAQGYNRKKSRECGRTPWGQGLSRLPGRPSRESKVRD